VQGVVRWLLEGEGEEREVVAAWEEAALKALSQLLILTEKFLHL